MLSARKSEQLWTDIKLGVEWLLETIHGQFQWRESVFSVNCAERRQQITSLVSVRFEKSLEGEVIGKLIFYCCWQNFSNFVSVHRVIVASGLLYNEDNSGGGRGNANITYLLSRAMCCLCCHHCTSNLIAGQCGESAMAASRFLFRGLFHLTLAMLSAWQWHSGKRIFLLLIFICTLMQFWLSSSLISNCMSTEMFP